MKNLRHVLSVVGEKLSDEEWRELQKELPVEDGKVLHNSEDTEIAYLIIRRKTLSVRKITCFFFKTARPRSTHETSRL